MPRPTQVLDKSMFNSPYGTLTLYGQAVQTCSGIKHVSNFLLALSSPTTPPGKPDGLGFSAFARHY